MPKYKVCFFEAADYTVAIEAESPEAAEMAAIELVIDDPDRYRDGCNIDLSARHGENPAEIDDEGFEELRCFTPDGPVRNMAAF